MVTDRQSAPAKINLTLEVLGRRGDGYHEVRTVLQAIDLADDLELTAPPPAPSSAPLGGKPGLTFNVEPKGAAPEEANLVLDAARLLEVETRGDMAIRLVKRIPTAAGLGGGSSDAAAALLSLRRFYGLNVSDEMLSAIAAKLGSDVPFFLSGGTALATGRGEQLSPLPSPVECCAVAVAPNAPELVNKTARMYGLLGPEHYSEGAATAEAVRRLREGAPLDGALFNVFDAVASRAHDSYDAMRERFLAAGALQPTLCGSGPAMFALAHDEAEAAEIAARMETQGYKAFATCLLPPTANPA